MITDIIIFAIVVLMTGGAIAYIIKEKKRGKKCIGCPSKGICRQCNNCNKNDDKFL